MPLSSRSRHHAAAAILVVEDTADDEALLIRALRKTGIELEILIARDGEQALHHLHDTSAESGPNRNRIRVVLCDLKLPKVDGIELLRRIRANPRTRMIPVVLFSSSAHEDEVASAYLHGANGYVRKPVDARSFATAVSQLGAYWLALNEAPPAARE